MEESQVIILVENEAISPNVLKREDEILTAPREGKQVVILVEELEQDIMEGEERWKEAEEGRCEQMDAPDTAEEISQKLEEDFMTGRLHNFDLWCAARIGHREDFVRALDKAIADARLPEPQEVEEKNGRSLLHSAADNGHDVVVEFIAKKYAHLIFHQNHFDGNTPLHVAARRGHLSTIQILLRYATDESGGFNLLLEKNRHEHIAKLIFHRNRDGETPLYIAVREGHLSVVKFLLDRAKMIVTDSGRRGDYHLLEMRNKDKHMALEEALEKRNHEIFEFLISEYKEMFESIVNHLLERAVRTYNKRSFRFIRSVFPKHSSYSPELQEIKEAYTSIIADKTGTTLKEILDVKRAEDEQGSGKSLEIEYENDAADMFLQLFQAAKKGNREKFVHMVEMAEIETLMKILSKGDHRGNSMLHVAAKCGNNEIVEFIASNFFAQVFRKNCYGDTALHVAARGGHMLANKSLLSHAKEEGADFGEDHLLLKSVNKSGHTALHEAVMNGSHQVVELFASQCKDISEFEYHDLLVLAIKAYNKPTFRVLLSVFPMFSSNMPKFEKAKAAYYAIIKEMEEKGSGKLKQPNRTEALSQNPPKDTFMLPALLEAAENGDTATFCNAFNKVKVEVGQSILEILSEGGPSGNSLLHEAASHENNEIVEYIASTFFAQVFNKNWQGDTPLHVAARVGSLSTIKILLHHGKEEGAYFGDNGNDYFLVKEKNHYGQTALHEAVSNGDFEIVKYLVDEYGQIFDDYKDEDHLLRTAIKSKNMDIVQVLLSALYIRLSSDSYVDAIKEAQHAAIFEAAHASIMNGRTGMFLEMLSKIPSLVQLTDKDGRFLLHLAAQRGNVTAVQKLLTEAKQRGTLFRADNIGMHPIHIASQQGNIEIIKMFVEESVGTTHLLTRQSQNILHVAAERGNDTVVRYTLKTSKMENPAMGDLVNQKDKLGNTPLHLAAKNSHIAVVLSLTWAEGVELNQLNLDGLTPLDVFWESNKNKASLRHNLTSNALRSAGCRESWDIEEGRYKGYRSEQRKEKRTEWTKNQVGALSTVATLVATVTFTAGFTVPGGYNNQGLATMLHKGMFQVFAIFNTVSFFLSILSIISCFYAIDDDDAIAENAFALAKRLFGIALVMMATAFLAAVYLGVSKLYWLAFIILVIGSLFLVLLFFECLRSLAPIFLQKPFKIIRYISYYMTRAMIFIFIKDHAK